MQFQLQQQALKAALPILLFIVCVFKVDAEVQFTQSGNCGKNCKPDRCYYASVPFFPQGKALCGGCKGTRLALNNDCVKKCPTGFKSDNVRDVCVPNGDYALISDGSLPKFSYCHRGFVEEYDADYMLKKVHQRNSCTCPIKHCLTCANAVYHMVPGGSSSLYAFVESSCLVCASGFKGTLDLALGTIACLKDCPSGFVAVNSTDYWPTQGVSYPTQLNHLFAPAQMCTFPTTTTTMSVTTPIATTTTTIVTTTTTAATTP